MNKTSLIVLLLASFFIGGSLMWNDQTNFDIHTSATCSPRMGPGFQFETNKTNSNCDTACQCAQRCRNNSTCHGFNIPSTGGWCLLVTYAERCAVVSGSSGWSFYEKNGEIPAGAFQTTTAVTNPPSDWKYHVNCKCLCYHLPRNEQRKKRQAELDDDEGLPFVSLPGGGKFYSKCPVKDVPPQFILNQYPDFLPVFSTTTPSSRSANSPARVYSRNCRCFCDDS